MFGMVLFRGKRRGFFFHSLRFVLFFPSPFFLFLSLVLILSRRWKGFNSGDERKAALAVEKSSQKNGSVSRMFAQVKLAQKRICMYDVCAKIVSSKYFVCCLESWTNKPSVGSESFISLSGFFSPGRERKFRRHKFVVLFFFFNRKKRREDSRKIRHFALRRRVATTWERRKEEQRFYPAENI